MIKVLLVDDTKTVHAYVRYLCQDLPIEFVSVNNGAEALIELENNPDVEVILLDWEMPVMNGPDTLEQFQKKGINIPVIMMTTKNSHEDVSKMLHAGVSEYMMKPFTLDIIEDKLSFVLGLEVKDAA